MLGLILAEFTINPAEYCIPDCGTIGENIYRLCKIRSLNAVFT